MKTKLFFLLTGILVIFNLQLLKANNIQVTSVTLTGQNMGSNYTYVQFNLSWDNSWRHAVNWDAAWVFVKYKASYDTTWKHALLNTAAGNHTIPGGYTGDPTSEGVGILIHRSVNGNGSVGLTNVQLRWEYGLNGVNDADQVQVKVFAVEMVYIPQGNFYAGDGTLSNVEGQFSQGNTTAPFLISGENALTLGGAPLTNLGNRNAGGMGTPDDFNNITTQILPALFPKGYNDFYCMKYEISQGQYTDFLNTLTRTQQKTRVASDISTDAITNIYVMTNSSVINFRNVISCPGSGNGTTQPITFSCNRQDRACNYFEWQDGAAYCDWAGLRPMTELEFEKACRGPLTAVADEYTWGTIIISAATNIVGTENGTEIIGNVGANCNSTLSNFSGGDGSYGPLRCGIFAKVSTTREQAGATYYGAMEMSGNLWERIVTVGNPTGRSFDGANGDGILSTLGNANVSNWPGIVSGEVTGATGSGRRGGGLTAGNVFFRTSDRSSTNFETPSRTYYHGFRGVRTSEVGTLRPNENNPRQK